RYRLGRGRLRCRSRRDTAPRPRSNHPPAREVSEGMRAFLHLLPAALRESLLAGTIGSLSGAGLPSLRSLWNRASDPRGGPTSLATSAVVSFPPTRRLGQRHRNLSEGGKRSSSRSFGDKR